MGETLLSASAISKCGRKEGRREVAIGRGMCATQSEFDIKKMILGDLHSDSGSVARRRSSCVCVSVVSLADLAVCHSIAAPASAAASASRGGL